MPEKKLKNTLLRTVKADITDLEVEAFVFYADSTLKLGAGFGNAIASRGGPKVQDELKALAPCALGDAVVTGAGAMKAKFIVHAVGPKFQEPDLEGKLKKTTLSALKRAEEKGVTQIAFPPLGVGFYGVAPDVSARVMLDAFKEHTAGSTKLKEIIICVRDTRETAPFEKALASLG